MIVRLASFGCYLGMKMMVIYSREEDDDWVTVATLSSHSNTVWDLAWDPAGFNHDDYDNCHDDCFGAYDEGHQHRFWSLWSSLILSSGNRLASCSEDSSVRIWRRLAPGNKEGVPVPTDSKEAWRCEATIQVLASKLYCRNVIIYYAGTPCQGGVLGGLGCGRASDRRW